MERSLDWLDPQLASIPSAPELVGQLLAPRDVDSVDVDVGDQPVVVERARRHGVLPQLHAAVRDHRVRGSDDFAPLLQRELRAEATHRHRLEVALLRVRAEITQRGIAFLVLKGLATGRLDHAVPSDRSVADIDLLVDVRDLGGVELAAAAAGFTIALPSEHVAKGRTWRDEDGLELDVHTRLHTLARPLPVECWSETDDFFVDGQRLEALSLAGRLAHAATHFALARGDYRKLSSSVDVVRIVARADPDELESTDDLLRAMGVGDMTWRVFDRLAVLLAEQAVVVGSPRRAPLELALRAVYEGRRPSRSAVRLAKAIAAIAAAGDHRGR